MGDIDGSSMAARSAQQSNLNLKRKPVKFLARIAGLFSFGSQAEQLDANKNFVDTKPDPNNELGNLLRLSVEDVSIPKADIVAVQDNNEKRTI